MKIEFCDVAFSFGDKCVFKHLTMNIEGAVTVIEGPSGEGKTTLLRLAAGLLTPDAGQILGVPEKPALMFQENRLLPWLTARENVAAVMDKPCNAQEWLELVELGDESESLPRHLSGGQQRRVALARALAYGGGVLLLDEPLKGLHEELIRRIIPRVREQGIPIVATSHSQLETSLWGGSVQTLTRQ